MVDQIEQLKAMREQAQRRIEHKRQIIKEQMHALAISADAKLIKSLNPLISNLEKSAAEVLQLGKTEEDKTQAPEMVSPERAFTIQEMQVGRPQQTVSDPSTALSQQSRLSSSNKVSSIAASRMPISAVEQTAESALANALNQSSDVSAPPLVTSPMATEPLPVTPIQIPVQIEVEQTPAQRTQSELEKIAAQLRANISQGGMV